MSSAESLSTRVDRATRRFAVAWRNRSLGLIAPVGVLDHDALGYRFQYLQGVGRSVEGFRPFIGFPSLERVYESPRLWPFFKLRIMDRKRPDFQMYVRWLGLEVDASPLDILSRSGGEQKGDSVSLIEEPEVADDGTTGAVFLVRGTSYALREYHTASVAESFLAGDELVLVDDDTNVVNSEALLLVTPDGARIGWMPDLLIEYARQVRSAGGLLEVIQNNGPDAPWHARLLVRLSGQLPTGRGVFSGSDWPPVLRR